MERTGHLVLSNELISCGIVQPWNEWNINVHFYTSNPVIV